MTAVPEAPTLERKIKSTPKGTLLQSFALVEPDTIQEAHQINKSRITDISLRNWYGWTADGNMYRLENEKGEQDANGDAFLYFSPRQHNLILREANIADAVSQLRTTENYKPKVQEVQEVVESVKSGETLRVKLADLSLQTYKGEKGWSYFEINTADYGSLNSAQRALAERVFGKGQDFVDYMRTLNETGKSITRVYVLNQNYVKQHAKEGAISRVSWLSFFNNSSDFNAVDGIVGNDNGGLRGVRREVAEGDTPQNPVQETDKVGSAYATLLDPGKRQEAVDYLRKNTDAATGLTALIADAKK